MKTKFIIIIIILATLSCTTKVPVSEKLPFEPSTGNSWPPYHILSAFKLADWEQPAGFNYLKYWAGMQTIIFSEFLENVYTLQISVGTSDLLSIEQTEQYLREKEFYLWNGVESSYGWLVGSDALYWLSIHLRPPGWLPDVSGGSIEIERSTSTAMKLHWPTANDLASFHVHNFSQLPGIDNIYYYLFHGQRTRLFCRFAVEDMEQTGNLLREYFGSFAEFKGGLFRYITGNKVYTYDFFITRINDNPRADGRLEFWRFETDYLPEEGYGWSPVERLSFFNLEDWYEPNEIEGIVWEAELGGFHPTLRIEIARATEKSMLSIQDYLRQKFDRHFQLDHWEDHIYLYGEVLYSVAGVSCRINFEINDSYRSWIFVGFFDEHIYFSESEGAEFSERHRFHRVNNDHNQIAISPSGEINKP